MIRECRVQKGGLFVGEPLRGFQGVLTGVPEYTGGAAPLLEERTISKWDGRERRKSSKGDVADARNGDNVSDGDTDATNARLKKAERGSSNRRAKSDR